MDSSKPLAFTSLSSSVSQVSLPSHGIPMAAVFPSPKSSHSVSACGSSLCAMSYQPGLPVEWWSSGPFSELLLAGVIFGMISKCTSHHSHIVWKLLKGGSSV